VIDHQLSPDELLTTTRAVRKRLDLARPVERELLDQCFEVALQAPSAGNQQSWHFVLATDRPKKTAIADLYRKSKLKNDPPTTTPEARRMMDSSAYLAEHLDEVPVLVIPCIEGRIEDASPVVRAVTWGSILPATWSFMLAARSRGLGTAWTALHLEYEREAADILGIPYEEVMQVAMIPVAHTIGSEFKPGARVELNQQLHWNSW
jgi:nitroreductase